jgi:MEDS: MEthanogen/methylotroph, DcmR Sensory domain
MEAGSHSLEIAGTALGRHRHICAFFNSMDEEHRVLRSFITDGVDQGDKAFHLVDPERREEHLRRLADSGIDVQEAMGNGQLEVCLWQDAYLREGRFDQDAMLALIEELLRSGAATGFRRVRLLAHMEWSLLDRPGVDDLLEYETRLNYVIPKYDDAVICTYDLSKFGANVVMDALRTHPLVIIGGLLQENPFFVPPDQFLLEIRERRAARMGAHMH